MLLKLSLKETNTSFKEDTLRKCIAQSIKKVFSIVFIQIY